MGECAILNFWGGHFALQAWVAGRRGRHRGASPFSFGLVASYRSLRIASFFQVLLLSVPLFQNLGPESRSSKFLVAGRDSL
jgi:hypothetical protein